MDDFLEEWQIVADEVAQFGEALAQ